MPLNGHVGIKMPLNGHVEVIGQTPVAALKAAAWPKFFERFRLNREKCTHASIGIHSLIFAKQSRDQLSFRRGLGLEFPTNPKGKF